MIRYTVLWRTDVENELATLWSETADRQSISVAADRLDAELQIDAQRKGNAVSEGLRLLSVSPLVAYFHIDEADRKVFVEAIRLGTH